MAKIKFKEQLRTVTYEHMEPVISIFFRERVNTRFSLRGECNFYIICTILPSVERTADPLGTVNASILQT